MFTPCHSSCIKNREVPMLSYFKRLCPSTYLLFLRHIDEVKCSWSYNSNDQMSFMDDGFKQRIQFQYQYVARQDLRFNEADCVYKLWTITVRYFQLFCEMFGVLLVIILHFRCEMNCCVNLWAWSERLCAEFW